MSLGDIAIYTDEEEVPLSQVFQTIYDKEGKKLEVADYKTDASLEKFFRKFFQIMTANVCIIQTSRKLYLGITR